MPIYTFLSPQFWLFFCLFFVAVFVTFFLPGYFFLKDQHKIPVGAKVVVATALGIALWGLQGYLLGYLGLRWLSYVYLLFFLWYFLHHRHHLPIQQMVSALKRLLQDRVIVLLVVAGVLIQMLPVFGSGMRYQDGVHLYGVTAYDGVMHLAFIESIAQTFPPIQPGAVGNPITNYHYWSDMIMADLVRVWKLPVSHVFFQYMPLFLSLLTALAGYVAVVMLGGSKAAGRWMVFFLFFAGDLTYLLILLVRNTINFATPAIDNGATQFLNMPHAMARMMFLAALIPLRQWIRSRESYWGVLNVLLFAVLIGIKVYFGIFVFFGFSLLVLYWLVKESFFPFIKKQQFSVLRKNILNQKKTLFLLAVLLTLSAIIFFPPNKGAGGLAFVPLEWPKIFLGHEVLNLSSWWNLKSGYPDNYLLLLLLDGIAIVIALLSIHGTRLLGFFPSRKLYRQLGGEMLVFLFPAVLLFHLLGLFTMQQSGGLNVFNFFAVSAVVLSLFTAFLLAPFTLKTKNKGMLLLTISIILLTIPRVMYESVTFLSKYSGDKADVKIVSNEELSALSFIRRNTRQAAVVQSHPKNDYDSHAPYVSALTVRKTYLSGGALQETHNQPVAEREEVLAELFSSNHPQEFVNRAAKAGIDYVYLRKVPGETLPFSVDENLLKPVFENHAVIVYQVRL